MSKKQPKTNRKKAGDSTIGLFESGEVLTQEKKTVQQGLVTSTMLPQSNPNSYWNTPAGIKRRIQMIEQNLKGTISGAKTTKKMAKEAKSKIADLKSQLKKLEGQ